MSYEEIVEELETQHQRSKRDLEVFKKYHPIVIDSLYDHLLGECLRDLSQVEFSENDWMEILDDTLPKNNGVREKFWDLKDHIFDESYSRVDRVLNTITNCSYEELYKCFNDWRKDRND